MLPSSGAGKGGTASPRRGDPLKPFLARALSGVWRCRKGWRSGAELPKAVLGWGSASASPARLPRMVGVAVCVRMPETLSGFPSAIAACLS